MGGLKEQLIFLLQLGIPLAGKCSYKKYLKTNLVRIWKWQQSQPDFFSKIQMPRNFGNLIGDLLSLQNLHPIDAYRIINLRLRKYKQQKPYSPILHFLSIFLLCINTGPIIDNRDFKKTMNRLGEEGYFDPYYSYKFEELLKIPDGDLLPLFLFRLPALVINRLATFAATEKLKTLMLRIFLERNPKPSFKNKFTDIDSVDDKIRMGWNSYLGLLFSNFRFREEGLFYPWRRFCEGVFKQKQILASDPIPKSDYQEYYFFQMKNANFVETAKLLCKEFGVPKEVIFTEDTVPFRGLLSDFAKRYQLNDLEKLFLELESQSNKSNQS